jgi:hypothetical protein
MTNSENPQVVSSSRPIQERVGLIVDGANAAAAIKTIVAAEDAESRLVLLRSLHPKLVSQCFQRHSVGGYRFHMRWLHIIF